MSSHIPVCSPEFLLTEPATWPSLTLADWNHLLPAMRRSGLLGRFYPKVQELGLLSAIPVPVRPHLEAAHIIAQEHERMIRWEVNRIQRALADTGVPVVLLKGAAYVLAELPAACGRLVTDVDILVPADHLAGVEAALRRYGWETVLPDDYDQHYYRRWMHELPPLRHRLRQTSIDIHHTILPTTGRLQPDPDRLLAAARPLGEGSLRVLAPADMVLHSAAHAFQDGALTNGLRDLVDLHELVTGFATLPGFWKTLVARADELALGRPLFYALRYCRMFLHTPIPESVLIDLRSVAPTWPITQLMDALVGNALREQHFPPWRNRWAQHLLYLRAHWLRMPPPLLAGHLLHKLHRRVQARLQSAKSTHR